MSADAAFRALSAHVASQTVKADDSDFMARHGGTPLQVLERERAREEWALKLLASVRKS